MNNEFYAFLYLSDSFKGHKRTTPVSRAKVAYSTSRVSFDHLMPQNVQ